MFPRIPLPGLPFDLPTYGLMVALGFLAALWLAERLGRKAGFTPHVVQDTAVWACIAGLIGAKVALLIIHPPTTWREALGTLFQGGVFYGGFAGAVGMVIFLCWKRRLDAQSLGDVLAAPLALGHAFGRIGCFLAGCCFGSPCTAPWAVRYTDPESMPMQSGILPLFGLHPVQIYEALGNLALAGMALWMLRRRRFSGQVIWTYVAAYGALRFTVEHWRGDARGMIGPFATSQAVGLAAIVLGLSMLAWQARRARGAPNTESTTELAVPETAGRPPGAP